MRTLNLKEAAEFLKMHPVTLSVKAKSGQINGAKIGKRWVFLEVDLLEAIRSKYQARALQSEKKETICHFTSARTPLSIGLNSPSVEKQYKEALGLAQKAKHKSSMTS